MSLEEMADSLNEPAVRYDIMGKQSEWIAHMAHALLAEGSESDRLDTELLQQIPPPIELTPEAFAVLYRPELPTIAIDPNNTFTGSELLGIAAAERPIANIVYIFGMQPGVVMAGSSDEPQLEINAGALIAADGSVHYGDFPTPIRAAVVDTTDDSLLEQYNALQMPTLNSWTVMRECDNKKVLAEVMEGSGVAVPVRVDVDELWEDDPNKEYVIKPSNRSQGTGVQFFADTEQGPLARQYYNFLRDYQYEPVVEERIRSYPLIDPETGDRLDWNVRAIVGQGNPVGMYIRASKWGGPVNKSLGARAILLEDLEIYGVDTEVAETVRQQLWDTTIAAARHLNTAVAGLDITVDEQLKSVLFEVNIGNTGGMQTLALLKQGRQAKLQNAHKLLDMWALNLRPSMLDDAGLAQCHTITPGLRALLNGIDATNPYVFSRGAASLSLETVLAASKSPHDFIRWALQAHTDKGLEILNPAARLAIERILCTEYPLEAARCTPNLIANAAAPEVLIEHTKLIEQIAPVSPELVLLRAYMHGSQKDFGTMQAAVTSAREKAATEDVITSMLVSVAGSLGIESYIDGMEDADYAALGTVLTTYCQEGYDVTIERFGSEMFSDAGTTHTASLNVLLLHLAVSEQRYEDGLQYAQVMVANDQIDVLALGYILHEYDSALISSEMGLRLALESDLAVHMTNSAIIKYLAGAMVLSEFEGDAMRELADQIAASASPDLSEDDIKLLGTAIYHNALACRDESFEWSLPPVAGPNKAATDLAHLLYATHHYDMPTVDKVLRRIQSYDLEDTFELVADITYDGMNLRDFARNTLIEVDEDN
jgi:glutathione synthase/RimK-type ligase-like ATP-grasp enzyme